MELFPLIRLLILSFLAFIIAISLTPVLTHYLYKYKVWKKSVRTKAPDGRSTPIFAKLHKDKETKTPRMGGLLIWLVTALVVVIFYILGLIFPSFDNWNFLSREETWLPMFVIIVAGIIGFLDDYLVVRGEGKYIAGGISFKKRVALVTLIGIAGAWWFYFKLGFSSIFIPFVGNVFIGWLIIPLFIVVMLAMFSSGVVDGLDGLAGGVFLPIFSVLTVFAYVRGQFDLATLGAVIIGSLLAYLWFNIPPARFYMGETGILALTTTATVFAFLTNAVILLPLAGIILVGESGSVILQLLSKKLRNGKKIFMSAPLHHHFEAIGWPAYKVTMRFWIISAVFSILALLLYFIGPR